MSVSSRHPSYSFVPGHWPHPTRDPEGHSYGIEPRVAEPLDLEKWSECKPYLEGVELFNAGYYWEAHEAWEDVWKAVGRKGVVGELLKGLIKLTAVGVKVRQGCGNAARSLLEQAASHLRAVHDQQSGSHTAGLNLCELAQWCDRLTFEVHAIRGDPTLPVEVLFEPLKFSENFGSSSDS